MPSTYNILIKPGMVKSFCLACLKKVGGNESRVGALGDVLVAADIRGHYSHGLNRLEMYINEIRDDACLPNAEPKIERETPSIALVNGMNGLGPVVGNFSMQLAIKKAKDTGIGWVEARGSNHFGICSWYAMQAAAEKMILAIGTNPMAVAAPALDNSDTFMLDMSTTSVALGKVELHRRRGIKIPAGWACDKYGKPTTDPEVALDGGSPMPLGGLEETGGHKGFGLGMMVEILCGVLANADYGPKIRRWKSTERPANLGHMFLALNPDAFGPGFSNRLSDYVTILRKLPLADPDKPFLIPGDMERVRMEKCSAEGVIRYPEPLIQSLDKLAEDLHVEKIKIEKTL